MSDSRINSLSSQNFYQSLFFTQKFYWRKHFHNGQVTIKTQDLATRFFKSLNSIRKETTDSTFVSEFVAKCPKQSKSFTGM